MIAFCHNFAKVGWVVELVVELVVALVVALVVVMEEA